METPAIPAIRRIQSHAHATWNSLLERNATLTRAVLAAFFVALTALAAQVELHTPLSPVPYTLQTLCVVLAGATLGARWGAASMSLYVLIGLLGAPVFSGGAAGITDAVLLSSGYLLAFPIGAALVGHLTGRPTNEPNRALLLAAPLGLGALTVFAIVDAWLLANRTNYFETLALTEYTLRGALGTLVLTVGLLGSIGLFAAYLFAKRRHRERFESYLAMLAAHAAILLLGTLVYFALANTTGLAPGIDGVVALELGVMPFVPSAFLKAAIALGLLGLIVPPKQSTF